MRRTILTIAGSDSSGGAGIQADLKAIAANGGYGASVITAVTAQNTCGVIAAETVSRSLLEAQLEAVFDDLRIAAVKTGMLASEEVIETVAAALQRWLPPHLVCDPVMISKTGFPLLPDSCVASLAGTLLPLAELVTPNVHEAAALAGIGVRTVADAEEAGRAILDLGPGAVLVKGGHLEDAVGTDVLVTGDGVERFPAEPIASRHTHGTGCTYASAIATWLGHGEDLVAAITYAKTFMSAAIAAGGPVGDGTGPTEPFFILDDTEAGRAWLERVRRARALDRERDGT